MEKVIEFWVNVNKVDDGRIFSGNSRGSLRSIAQKHRKLLMADILKSVDIIAGGPEAEKSHILDQWPSGYDLYGECVVLPVGSLSNTPIPEQIFEPLSRVKCGEDASLMEYLVKMSSGFRIPETWPITLINWWNIASNPMFIQSHFSLQLKVKCSALDFFLYFVTSSYGAWFLCEKDKVDPEDELRRPKKCLVYYYGIPSGYLIDETVISHIRMNGYSYGYGKDATESTSIFLTATSRQNAVICRWDPGRIMFSSGNISEKVRMASYQIPEPLSGSIVIVDMFAGIGYFALQILKHQASKIRKLYAIEMNHLSFYFLTRNLVLNRIKPGICVTLMGDNIAFANALRQSADRILLGYLPSSERAWKAAIEMLKVSGGILHIHENVPKEQIDHKRQYIQSRLSEHLASYYKSPVSLWDIKTIHIEVVKSVAPGILHIVYDVSITPSK